MINNWWKILILGLLFRLIIAPFTYHPDVKILGYTSAVIFREYNFNPYGFANSLAKDDPRKEIYSKEVADDLPLLYLIRIPFDIFLRYTVDPQIEYRFLKDSGLLLGNTAFFPYLLFLKIPLIVFDLLLGIILSLLVSKKFKNTVLALWMINPVTLWSTAAIGQHDVIPTFFMVLSMYFLQKEHKMAAAFTLGLGAAIKSFPFLIAPYLVLLGKSWSERLKLASLISLPYLFSVLPFVSSAEFRQQALFAPHLAKMLYAKIPLSGGEGIMIVPVVLLVLYLLYEQKEKSYHHFLSFSGITLLLVLALTHFHIQWFLWATPFIILYFIADSTHAEKLSFILLAGAVTLMLFLFDASLQVRLFSPIFTNLANAPGLAETLNKTSVDFLRDLAATIFLAASLFLSIRILTRKRLNNRENGY